MVWVRKHCIGSAYAGSSYTEVSTQYTYNPDCNETNCVLDTIGWMMEATGTMIDQMFPAVADGEAKETDRGAGGRPRARSGPILKSEKSLSAEEDPDDVLDARGVGKAGPGQSPSKMAFVLPSSPASGWSGGRGVPETKAGDGAAAAGGAAAADATRGGGSRKIGGESMQSLRLL